MIWLWNELHTTDSSGSLVLDTRQLFNRVPYCNFTSNKKYYVYKRCIFYMTYKTMRLWHYCDSNVTWSHIRHVVITHYWELKSTALVWSPKAQVGSSYQVWWKWLKVRTSKRDRNKEIHKENAVICHVYFFPSLGAFTKLLKATISFFMSVRPSNRMEQLGSQLDGFS